MAVNASAKQWLRVIWLQSLSGNAVLAVLNLKHHLLLFFLAVIGALNVTFRKKNGTMMKLLKPTHSSLKFGIQTIQKKNIMFISLMTFSTLTALSGTTLSTKHNNLYIKINHRFFGGLFFILQLKLKKLLLYFLRELYQMLILKNW